MKRASLLLLTLAMVLLPLGTVQAHVLREDHGISGVLHMPPSDEPRANEPTSLNISFGDKNGTLNLADCNCNLQVSKDGKDLAKVPLKPQAKLSAAGTYTFPAIGVYDVVVTGTPRNSAFPTFQLTYIVRVASDVRTTASLERKNSNTVLLIVSFGVLAGIALLANAGMRDGGRYSKNGSLRK